MFQSRTLPQAQINEIYFLSTQGCPCCHQPLRAELLAKAYNVSRSQISRIKNHSYKNEPLFLTIKEQVALVKRVTEQADG